MLLIDTVLPLEYLGLGGVVLIVYTRFRPDLLFKQTNV